MNYKVQDLGNVVLLEVEGRIDHSTAPAFGSALLPQVEGCAGEDKKLLIDLSKVTYMSSAGLRVLMIAAKGCRKQSGKIVLAALQPSVQEVFKIGRFDMVLETFPTVRAALGAISPAAAALYGER
jgi:anti-anti-sigma factor